MYYFDLFVELFNFKEKFAFIFVSEFNSVKEILFFCKYSANHLCSYLIDLVSFDNIGFKNRFKICYNVSSFITKNFMFIFCSIFFITQFISINELFTSSIWMEREVFDMFGIFFLNNWDMRKILTDYTFFGFPLRKDFPLSGFLELVYIDKLKSSFEVAIELMQELRFFLVSASLEFWEDTFGFKL